MKLATHWIRRSTCRWLVAALVMSGALVAGASFAQSQPPPPNTPPGVDHYLVYPVLQPPTITIPVILGDQFIPQANYVTTTLEYFMVPVNKNNEGILHPELHYTWWKVNPYPFAASCVIANQFLPSQPFDVKSPEYLLNPALKNVPTGQIPLANHYLAYDAFAPPVGFPVSLLDQFGQWNGVVLDAKFLAPPALKIFNGVYQPIVDPVPHMAIYNLQIQPPLAAPIPCVALDEFGTWQLLLGTPLYLAVPSYKLQVVGTKTSTWGRIKELYR